MTGVPLRDKKTEEEDVTYAPFVVAMGMLLASITLTFWAPGTLAALAVIFAGIALWVRESVLENRRLTPPEAERGFPEGEGLRAPSVYWWGAAGFAFIQWMVLGASLRVASAHGLLDPNLPDVPVTPWVGHTATLVALLSGGLGVWAVRAGRHGDMERLTLPVALFLGTSVVHLLLVAVQLLYFTQGMFLVDHAGARSAAWWVFTLHLALATGVVIALMVLLVRIRIHPLSPRRYGVVQALVLFWASMLVSWLVLYAALYLQLIHTEAHLI